MNKVEIGSMQFSIFLPLAGCWVAWGN